MAALPQRVQEQVKRAAMDNLTSSTQSNRGGVAPPTRYKRVDWLRERIYFEGLEKMMATFNRGLGSEVPMDL
ncbi:hypothetical protein JOM56_003091 [Amanita muscaria]